MEIAVVIAVFECTVKSFVVHITQGMDRRTIACLVTDCIGTAKRID